MLAAALAAGARNECRRNIAGAASWQWAEFEEVVLAHASRAEMDLSMHRAMVRVLLAPPGPRLAPSQCSPSVARNDHIQQRLAIFKGRDGL